MQRFDCLALDCPIFGPHILEASAGTGKTFSIEHVFVRLVLASVDVEQILTVTFTNAATRELKTRIRANLEKALLFLLGEEAGAWPYLHPYFGSSEAKRALRDAISAFDRCQIYTIHGFCYRMLKEFAYEANMGFSLPDPEERKTPAKLRRAAIDFLQFGLGKDWICSEQCSLLMKKYKTLDELAEVLLKPAVAGSVLFSQLVEQYQEACKGWKGVIEEKKLVEDFLALQSGYKVKKGNFLREVSALAKSFQEPAAMKGLFDGSLFDFLSPSNRKVKAVTPQLHYPGFFDWAGEHLAPFLDQSTKQVLQMVRSVWNPIAEKILYEEEHLNPDEILLQMRKAIALPEFAQKVREKYVAAIIDEFQDTDEVQWDIFRSLFLENSTLRALYLVGDPKQSIYRFRKADVYTYLKARDFLGEAHLYHLDTNFRSSKKLLGALNALFARDWLTLPKVNRTLPYIPVRAGREGLVDFADEKGALHFFFGEEETFLPYVYQEIEKLRTEVENFSHFAILVKDRYQAERALNYLKDHGISAVARSHTPLGKTVAFQTIQELFAAVLSPRDFSAIHIVMAGPFGELPFIELKGILEERGLVPFFRKILDCSLEKLVSFDLSFYRDVLQIFELFFLWEKSEGFSFEGLKRHLRHLEKLSPDEGGRRRMDSDENAVQIMTLHVSKGLEFEVVFALGLASRTQEAEEEVEELNAEKLRQLYVAMTRAKRRLYVPIAESQREGKPGVHSPIELFSQILDKPLLEQLKTLSESESLTFEHLTTVLDPVPLTKEGVVLPEFKKSYRPFFPASYLSSFTSLAKPKEYKPLDIPEGILPAGAETGVMVHALFERIFLLKIWNDPQAVAQLIQEDLRFSPFQPWITEVQKMVRDVLDLPLDCDGERFSLSELTEVEVEMEFLFSAPPDFVKGFIDLVFSYNERYYFLDWKTNWLAAYDTDSLKQAMESHSYDLQGTLYAEALRRHFGEEAVFGGAIYLFVRHPAAYHFYPEGACGTSN